MSWMIPVSADMGCLRCAARTAAAGAAAAAAAACARRGQRVRVVVVLEEFLHPAAPLLEPVQREGQVRDRVADDVVCGVALEPDQQRPFVAPGLEAAPAEFGQQFVGALVDVYEQDLAHL